MNTDGSERDERDDEAGDRPRHETCGRASELVVSLSHELRAPLHVIIGLAELLADEEDPPSKDELRRFAGDIHRAGEHLLSIVNDILDLSRIEVGKLRAVPELLHLRSVLEAAVAFMGIKARPRRVAISCKVTPPDMPVYADERRLTQILYNLLDNAIKYSPAGGEIRAIATSDGDMALVRVIDQGPGVPAADRERIFQPSRRPVPSACAEAAHGPTGTGLGLPLSRQLVEMQGGRIRVEEPDPEQRGSVFSFCLPLGPPDAE